MDNFLNVPNLWDQICNLVIRPQRNIYDPNLSLGPRLFTLGNKIYERKDVVIKNQRDMKLQCSHYQPIESQRPSKQMPCVVYCHGNCGCRVDALDAVQLLLPKGITVFCFDFSGSGLSDGEYVSLGFYEVQDVLSVVTHLQQTKSCSKISLWGRSMGAATTLMFYGRSGDDSITSIVADSAFLSLEDIIKDLILNFKSWIPLTAVKIAQDAMKKSIITRAFFDITENCPVKYVKNLKIPVLFAHAEGDNFIKKKHSEELYKNYGGDKTVIFFDGDHNSSRPEFFFDQVVTFFERTLLGKDGKKEEKKRRKNRRKKERSKEGKNGR